MDVGLDEKTKEKHEKPYEKYAESFRKISIFKLINCIISILLVFLAILLPVFRYNTIGDVLTLESFNGDMQKYLEYLADLPPDALITGKINITSSFSCLDEIVRNIEYAQTDTIYSMIGLSFMLFPLFTIIMGISLLIISFKGLFEIIGSLKNKEQTLMLEYNIIRKTGKEKEKKSFIKTQNLYSFIMFIIFDIIFGKVEGELYGSNGIGIEEIKKVTYWVDFNGFSFSFYLMVAIFIAYIVFSIMLKSEKKKVIFDITKDELLKNDN